jgi:hypothetical protein
MPVPTNTTPETAILLSDGYSFTINAADLNAVPAGVGYGGCDPNQRHALWWKWVGGSEVLFAFGLKGIPSGANYAPIVTVWKGTIGSLTIFQIVDPVLLGTIVTYCMSIIPTTGYTPWVLPMVTPGENYYIQVTDANATPVDVDVTFLAMLPPNQPIADGDLIVPSEFYGLPAGIIDPTTGKIKAYRMIPTGGEFGDAVKGYLVVWDTQFDHPLTAGFGADTILNGQTLDFIGRFYREWAPVTPGLSAWAAPIADATKFYDITYDDINSQMLIQPINVDGTLGTLITIPYANVKPNSFFEFSQDGKKIYYDDYNTSTIMKVWDLEHNVALPDLMTSPDSFNWLTALPNGNIVIYIDGASNKTYVFNSSGILINTITRDYTVHRAVRIPGENSIWVWGNDALGAMFVKETFPAGTELIRVRHASLTHISGPAYSNDADAIPFPWAHQSSCPLLILTSSATPPVPPNPSSGIYKLVPGKHNDTLWVENFTGTFDVKIP